MADRIDELALLAAILDAGSLAGAARRIGRSASVATRMLRDMESRLGVRLADRTTRALVPTEAGVQLGAHGRRILAEYEGAISEVSGAAREPRGLLRISAPYAFGRLHLTRIVSDFLAAHPRVQVELTFGNEWVNLLEQQVDVAVRFGKLQDSSLVAKPVGAVRRVVVASPAYLERRGRPKSPADLEAHDVIVQKGLHGMHVWEMEDADGRPLRLRPRARLVVNDAEAAIEAAVRGCGIARPLSYQAAAALKSKSLVRLLSRFAPRPVPVQLVVKSARHVPLRIRAFVEFAGKALRQLDALKG